MSDIRHQSWEDEQMLLLLDDMAGGTAEDPQELLTESSDGDADALRRACVESLALMPYELPAVAPPAELKVRLLVQVASGGEDSLEYPAKVEKRPPRASSPRWVLPLAATLAIALFGVTGWQIWRVEEQAGVIGRLSLELEEARVARAELAAAREVAAEAQARLQMLMSSTAEYCALKPTQSCPNQQARGTLVMQRGRSDWFLRVEGLGPCEKGRQYKLWFVTDSKPILGASFAVEGSHDLVEIRATGAPAGVKAVMITLEQPEVEAAPESPVLLYGDQRMRLL